MPSIIPNQIPAGASAPARISDPSTPGGEGVELAPPLRIYDGSSPDSFNFKGALIEADAADLMGISKMALKKIRGGETLVGGTDYLMQEGKATLWSVEGVTAAMKVLGGSEIAPVEKKEAAETITLVVERVAPNPMILLTVTLDGVRCRCRVKDNINFKPGMELEGCVPINDRGFYVFKGRCPKKRKYMIRDFLAQFAFHPKTTAL